MLSTYILQQALALLFISAAAAQLIWPECLWRLGFYGAANRGAAASAAASASWILLIRSSGILLLAHGLALAPALEGVPIDLALLASNGAMLGASWYFCDAVGNLP